MKSKEKIFFLVTVGCLRNRPDLHSLKLLFLCISIVAKSSNMGFLSGHFLKHMEIVPDVDFIVSYKETLKVKVFKSLFVNMAKCFPRVCFLLLHPIFLHRFASLFIVILAR